MGKIFTLKDLKVAIEPQALLMEPFSTIWNKDKSKDKVTAYNQIQYIWFFTDFDSPYFNNQDNDKDALIKKEVINNTNFKVDDTVKEGIETYRRLNVTPAMEMLEAAQDVVSKIKNHLKSVDFTEVDDSGKFVFDIKEITDIVTKLPKLTESILHAKELCKKEQATVNRVRGNASVGMFED